jgi:D-arabinose 1-dehydrogenase-like Zn-dependent alcohol dehydrogenase
VRDGGTIVVSGATTGDASPAELSHLFFRQISILGATMGTREELERLLGFCSANGVRPSIQEVLPLREARRGLEQMLAGSLVGKIVFVP